MKVVIFDILCSLALVNAGIYKHQPTPPVVTQISYDRQPPMVVCPQGFQLNGSQCVRQQSTAPDQICQPGFTLRNGECHRQVTSAADQVCPNSTTRDRQGNCVMTETDRVEEFCSLGFTRVGSTCQRQDAADAAPRCNAPLKLMNNQCVDTVQALAADIPPPSCESGAQLKRDGTCVFKRKDSKAPTKVCPTGYELQGTYCVKFVMAQEVCDRGFTLNLNTEQCERDYEEPARDLAPDAGPPTCNPPAVYNSSSGMCDVIQQPDYICPATFSRTGTTSCSKITTSDIQRECPNGFNLESNQCIRTSFIAADQTCPRGAQLNNGQCVSFDRTAAAPDCPTGFTLQGNSCNQMEIAQPSVQCDIGYQLANGECIRPVEVYEQPPPPVSQHTPVFHSKPSFSLGGFH
eukprot:GHVL01032719.1.p1 GENE.GHVL01032719.1~~GHVL01032719.1.p1  ORF type:complete len:404 (+),score=56.21 GHVL01032719.1:79-1290(+)